MTSLVNFHTESGYAPVPVSVAFSGTPIGGRLYPNLFEEAGSGPSAPPADLLSKKITENSKTDVEKFARIRFVDKDDSFSLETGTANFDIKAAKRTAQYRSIREIKDEQFKMERPAALLARIGMASLAALLFFSIPAFALGLTAGGAVITGGAVLTFTASAVAGFALYRLHKDKVATLEEKCDRELNFIDRVSQIVSSSSALKSGLEGILSRLNIFHVENPDVMIDQVAATITI